MSALWGLIWISKRAVRVAGLRLSVCCRRLSVRVSNPGFTETENPGYPGFFQTRKPGFWMPVNPGSRV